jgi:hypothetical protein
VILSLRYGPAGITISTSRTTPPKAAGSGCARRCRPRPADRCRPRISCTRKRSYSRHMVGISLLVPTTGWAAQGMGSNGDIAESGPIVASPDTLIGALRGLPVKHCGMRAESAQQSRPCRASCPPAETLGADPRGGTSKALLPTTFLRSCSVPGSRPRPGSSRPPSLRPAAAVRSDKPSVCSTSSCEAVDTDATRASLRGLTT